MLPGDYFACNGGCKSRHHLIKRLQALECLELLVGIETSLKNEVTQKSETSTGGKHSELNYSAGMLAGSTPMTDTFCEYLPFARLSELLVYSESTGIPLDECPVLLSIFSS